MPQRGNVKVMRDPKTQKLIKCSIGIRNFLQENGPSTYETILGFLSKFMRKDDLYSKPGLIKMIKMDPQIKIDESHLPYICSYQKTPDVDITNSGLEFSQIVSKNLLTATMSDTKSSVDKEERLVDELVRKMGCYYLYMEMVGWNLASMGKNQRDAGRIMDDWRKSVTPMPFVEAYFYFRLRNLLESDSHPLYEEKELRGMFSSYKLKMSKISKLSTVLRKKYPKETKAFEKSEDMYDFFNAKFKQIQERLNKKLPEKWHLEEIKKEYGLKESKQKISPNTCPSCKYDGTGKIKSGPLAGKRIRSGFSVQYREKDAEWRFCPQCGNMKIAKLT